jgi:hypothetical protein
MAYNLKKYLKFVTKSVKSNAKALALLFLDIKLYVKTLLLLISQFKFRKTAVIKI